MTKHLNQGWYRIPVVLRSFILYCCMTSPWPTILDTPVIWQNKPSEHLIYIDLLLTLIIQQSKTTNKTSLNKLKLSKRVLSAVLSHFVDALPIGDDKPRHGYFYTGDARHRAIELRYSKRYFGHYGPHWGYRFIQSSWLGDKFLWTSAWGMIVLTKEVQD